MRRLRVSSSTSYRRRLAAQQCGRMCEFLFGRGYARHPMCLASRNGMHCSQPSARFLRVFSRPSETKLLQWGIYDKVVPVWMRSSQALQTFTTIFATRLLASVGSYAFASCVTVALMDLADGNQRLFLQAQTKLRRHSGTSFTPSRLCVGLLLIRAKCV